MIWSFYTKSINALCQRYAQYGVLRYDGQVADVAERRESVRRFQEDQQRQLFVANPAAAGAGITLHSARFAIYESFSNQAAHYLQSLDRIHRRGQTRDVEYLILLCDGTLEIRNMIAWLARKPPRSPCSATLFRILSLANLSGRPERSFRDPRAVQRWLCLSVMLSHPLDTENLN